MSAALHSTSDLDSSGTDSITSSPRYVIQPSNDRLIRFMCSFGGNILPRYQDNQLRYVGGDTRIVAMHRSSSFSLLIHKLSKLSGIPNVCVKYQLPNEDLDSLVSVTTEEDMENMMEEYDRAARLMQARTVRFRLFLSRIGEDPTRECALTSLLDGSAKRENWFLDTLKSRTRTECSQSECSSFVSEPPDYHFGLDHEEPSNTRAVSPAPSDPGSSAPVVPSSFSSSVDVAFPVISPDTLGTYVSGSHYSTGPVYYLPPMLPGVGIHGQYVQQPFHGPVVFQTLYGGPPAVPVPCMGGEVNHPFAYGVSQAVPVPGNEMRRRIGPNV